MQLLNRVLLQTFPVTQCFNLENAPTLFFGSSLLSVGSTRFQDGEAAWRFLAPTGIDPRGRRQLLRWS
jgi:hypothetical protein